MNGLQRVSWEALQAWSIMSGEYPEHWEIGVLTRLDDEYLSAESEEPASEHEKTKAVAQAKDTVRSSAGQGRRVVKRQPKAPKAEETTNGHS